ncbi:DUF3556 domain-containing protein [Pseudonocardia bannensis]|uniref:DUF3556 family protein n=1 Tax=Pseudonocardia bannensis TaxID=630973 RepID=A0A848DPQ9_9PSEU|nr:DUF3556 domain-containing protein [Pseudonocardia bannensis]NMH94426.1 DUF3556 family protein [Pseudonocardia bannensis]
MGFIAPDFPDLDREEWKSKPRLDRIKPLAQHWAEHGFGTPYAVYLLYVIKLVGYVLGGIAIIALTPGLGSVGDFTTWWTEPVVYQKVVIWTLLYEVLGFGCGSMPLTLRFLPPVGAFLHWLRPGTIRLAPWPDKVPLTRGTTRTVVDVLLYLVVIASAAWLLFAPGSPDRVPAGHTVGLLDPTMMIPLLAGLVLIGLRDKTIFLAARGEQYALTVVVFFFPYIDMLIGWKLIMLALWWGAATSKLNHHFPYVVAVMISNSPLQRIRWFKRKFYRDYPNDLRPSGLAAFAAHTGTVIEYTVPLVLVLSDGGIVTTLALGLMVIFHLHILSTFPMGVPLEWNIFFIYSALFLFGANAEVSVFSLSSPLLGVILLVALVGIPALGNAKPHLVSFLPSMRYYAGNWATSFWCFRKGADGPGTGAENRLNDHIVKAGGTTRDQLAKLYDDDTAELMLAKAMAWRSLHSHGRALNGLLPRALDDVEAYDVREGEFTAGVILGWNFGEGHLHDESLLRAVQERCGFAPGELRVIMLESQPMQHQRQHYRIHDAATGLVEEGYVQVKDMIERQPWLDGPGSEIPVQVTGGPGRHDVADVTVAHD